MTLQKNKSYPSSVLKDLGKIPHTWAKSAPDHDDWKNNNDNLGFITLGLHNLFSIRTCKLFINVLQSYFFGSPFLPHTGYPRDGRSHKTLTTSWEGKNVPLDSQRQRSNRPRGWQCSENNWTWSHAQPGDNGDWHPLFTRAMMPERAEGGWGRLTVWCASGPSDF